MEPGLRAWDQADGPSIGQGEDMKLHGLILADISRKSNFAIQAYQDGIALLPAACGVGRGGRLAATRQGFLPPPTLAPASSDVINSRIQAPSHDFGGCRAVARGDRLDDFQMKIAMPKAVFTRLHLAEGHVAASLPARGSPH